MLATAPVVAAGRVIYSQVFLIHPICSNVWKLRYSGKELVYKVLVSTQLLWLTSILKTPTRMKVGMPIHTKNALSQEQTLAQPPHLLFQRDLQTRKTPLFSVCIQATVIMFKVKSRPGICFLRRHGTSQAA